LVSSSPVERALRPLRKGDRLPCEDRSVRAQFVRDRRADACAISNRNVVTAARG
jgi:hypothetical protein